MPIIIMDEGPGSAAAPPMNNGSPPNTIDLAHFTTPPGWAKIAQVVLGIVTIASGPPFLLNVVAWLALWGTVPWCWIHFFQITKKYAINPPWIVLEFYFTAGALLAYAVMTLICFISLHILSAVFGLLTAVAYAAGTYFLFLEWRAWRENPVNSATSVPK